jgi:hypothetical protein
MAKWVKCTLIAPQDTTTFVNLDQAFTVTWLYNRSRITIPGNDNAFIEVKERPDELLK